MRRNHGPGLPDGDVDLTQRHETHSEAVRPWLTALERRMKHEGRRRTWRKRSAKSRQRRDGTKLVRPFRGLRKAEAHASERGRSQLWGKARTIFLAIPRPTPARSPSYLPIHTK